MSEQAHDAAAESEARFRSLFDNNPDAMLTFDSDSIVTAANAAAGRALAIDPDALVGRGLLDLVVPADVPIALGSFNRALAGIAGGAEIRIAARATSIPMFLTMIPILVDHRSVGVHVHLRDRRTEIALQTLAYTDTVTTLPNRLWLIEHLRDRLNEARAAGTSIGVLFLDLDRFKDINDTLGHESGDLLLQIVGKRLKGAIRGGDRVARMGGDEFVVLALDAPDVAALAVLAERIIAAVEEPIHLGGMEHFVTTSIGIALYPTDADDADTLVKHADVAMYRAKDRGRNTYQFFTPALNATLQTRLMQEKTLRKALENHEFVVYYQPQHDLVSGDLVAVEALVRWIHPRSGLLLPGHFIPNAELSGLIVGLGDFVLETACADIAELRRTHAPELRLSVNLSARQFHQQRIARNIRAALDEAGLDPTALEVEITESVAMSDAELTIGIMRDLGSEGVRMSVDDFGTGYSSLSYLRRFPLDAIKIDRSFVIDLAHEPDDATIVRAVIAMAHALDLEVVAEGVETEQQLDFMREQRCDRVQGFYYSQAISRTALAAYIDGRTKRPAKAV